MRFLCIPSTKLAAQRQLNTKCRFSNTKTINNQSNRSLYETRQGNFLCSVQTLKAGVASCQYISVTGRAKGRIKKKKEEKKRKERNAMHLTRYSLKKGQENSITSRCSRNSWPDDWNSPLYRLETCKCLNGGCFTITGDFHNPRHRCLVQSKVRNQ